MARQAANWAEVESVEKVVEVERRPDEQVQPVVAYGQRGDGDGWWRNGYLEQAGIVQLRRDEWRLQ
jgi:hypothetical protein